MRHTQKTRHTVSLVSYSFLVIGLIALAGSIFRMARGSFHLTLGNFGILGIAIFFGLRRHSAFWRKFALGFIWYEMVSFTATLLFCGFFNQPALKAKFAQASAGSVSWLDLSLIVILLFTISQYRILTHRAVRRLFVREEAANPSLIPAEEGGETDSLLFPEEEG